MTRDELKKLLKGPIATVPTAFDDDYEIDLGRMAAETEWWVENGLVTGKAVIKVAAAMGEGPMLGDDEWPYLLRTVVQAAKGKAAIVCGIHYKDTKRSIKDARRAQDLGAIGLQISPPIFNHPTQDDILRYYEAVSNAIDIGILVYNTHWYWGGNVEPASIMKMADFEHVVAIKWSAPQGTPYETMKDWAHIFNAIDNSSHPGLCYKLGGRGYINMTSDVYPPHDLKVSELLEAGQYDEAQALYDKINHGLRDFYTKTAAKSGGEARVKKGMFQVMGRPMGTSRPPSQPLNAQELDELRQIMIGFGWPVPAAPVKV